MKRFKISVYVLGSITLIIVTGYLLSRVNLAGLNTERSILLQVIDKDRLLEKKLRAQNSSLNIQLAALAEQAGFSTEVKTKCKPSESAVRKGGNRGYLFRNPRYTEPPDEE